MDGGAQALYNDWGPIFKSLRGACWWLVSNPVQVEALSGGAANVTANAFTSGGGCTDPSTEGGNGPFSQVRSQGSSSTDADTLFRLESCVGRTRGSLPHKALFLQSRPSCLLRATLGPHIRHGC